MTRVYCLGLSLAMSAYLNNETVRMVLKTVGNNNGTRRKFDADEGSAENVPSVGISPAAA